MGSTPHALAMFQSKDLRNYLIKESGWIPPSFSVNKFDMGALISKSFLQISRKLVSQITWERIKDDLIVFDELNNTRDRVMIDILLKVSYISYMTI